MWSTDFENKLSYIKFYVEAEAIWLNEIKSKTGLNT